MSKQAPELGSVKEALSPFKPEDYLFDDSSLAHFLTDALNDDGDLVSALIIAARARGIADICAATGLSREVFAAPTLNSISRVLQVLKLRLAVVPSGSGLDQGARHDAAGFS